MNTVCRRIVAMLALAFATGHCGAGGTGGNVDHGPDGGLAEASTCEGSAAPSGGAPRESRPQATACGLSSSSPPGIDSGTGACSSDADCSNDAGSDLPLRCFDRNCVYDACLTDSDCAASQVCVCGSNNGGGLRLIANVCVPGNCRVDADCGHGEYCSPSRGYCGGVDGYYCHTKSDTCVDPVRDCGCGGNACVYTPTVGHFVCGVSVCAG